MKLSAHKDVVIVMKVRIGDRFLNTNGVIWEITSIKGKDCTQTLIDSGTSDYNVGISIENELLAWTDSNIGWKYIGNFSKADKFQELYNLLNS